MSKYPRQLFWFLLTLLVFIETLVPLRAATGNYIDRIDFGNVASESAHNFMPGVDPSTIAPSGVGPYGFTYRYPYGVGKSNPVGQEVLKFTVACNPNKQNYISVKLWGNDNNTMLYLLDSKGNRALTSDSALGPYALSGDLSLDCFYQDTAAPAFPNRYYYYTIPIPISLTKGKTSVQLGLHSLAGYNRYGTPNLDFLNPGQQARPIYTAYIHTAPCLVPDSSEVVGSAPPVSGAFTNTNIITPAQAEAYIVSCRSNMFKSGGALDQEIALQIWTNNTLSVSNTNYPPPPPEVMGLVLAHASPNTWPATNADGWRIRVAAAGAAYLAGYTPVPGQLVEDLAGAYVTPPYTNTSGSVVSGLDRYHDANILARLVKAIDSSTYLIDSDGGFCQQGNTVTTAGDQWTGLCSPQNPRTQGSYIGTTSRLGTVHGGGDLQGSGTYKLGWAICELLSDTNGGTNSGRAALLSVLDPSNTNNAFDADFTGTNMPRVYAWERMLYSCINFYAQATGGTTSQNQFQMLGMYANWVALCRLQALFPNTNYVVKWDATNSTYNNGAGSYLGTNSPLLAAEMVCGLYPSVLRGAVPSTNAPGFPGIQNYAMTPMGLGEGGGSLACGFDGGAYGMFIGQFPLMISQIASWDTVNVDSNLLARFSQQDNKALTAYSQLILPLYNIGSTITSGFASNAAFTFCNEDFVTWRSYQGVNSKAGSFEVYMNWGAAGTNGIVNNALARRAAYITLTYLTNPSLPGDATGLQYFEQGVRGLVNVDPSTLTKFPFEPNASTNYVWVDPMAQSVALRNGDDTLFLNANWRRSPGYPLTQWARIHYKNSYIDRGATVFMPFETNTVQADGNISSTNLYSTYVISYGDYMFAFNSSSNSATFKLPPGYGQAKDLVSSNYYNLGSTITVSPSNAAVLWLAASVTSTNGAGVAPTVLNPATASTNVVTGTSVNLSVLGADAAGETNLTYTWSLSGYPPNPVTFSANSNNAAKNTTATFASSGTYNFTVVISNASGLVTNSSVSVTVNQMLSSSVVTPSVASITSGQSIQFTASGYDQFGMVMKTPQQITWSVPNGFGSITPIGLYTAPTNSGGTAFIGGNVGAFTAVGTVSVAPPVGSFSGVATVGSFGTNQIAGTATVTNTTNGLQYTLTAGAGDNWGTNSTYKTCVVPITGDSTITARVVSISNDHEWVKAGVVFCNSFDTADMYAMMFDTPRTNHGVAYQYRGSYGGTSGQAGNITGVQPPQWVRMVRSGNTFTGYYSPDTNNGAMPTNWTQVGSSSIGMGSTVYVGLSLVGLSSSSYSSNYGATAVFDNVTITQPTVTNNVIFPYFTNVTIGTLGTYSENTNSNSVTISGVGGDVWGTSDSMQYAFRQMAGNGTVTVRTVSISTNTNNPYAKVGVMIRESAAAGSKEVNTCLSMQNKLRMSYRAATGGTTAETVLTNYSAPYWLRVARNGSSFSSYASPDGTNWSQVASTTTISMSSNALMGVFVSAYDSANPTKVTFDNITVDGTTNQPPLFTNQPVASSTGLVGNLSVQAFDDGGASNLTYNWYVLGNPPGNVTISTNNGTAAATNVTVNLGTQGTYYFEVVATDYYGASATSSIVALITPPAPPATLSAIGGTNTVALNWSTSVGASSYSVKRATNSGGPYTNIASGLNSASYTDTNFPISGTGGTYYYVVTAVNAQGESANSPESSATVLNPPAPPTGFSLSGNSGALSLGWSNSASATSYQVNRATNSGGTGTNLAVTTNTYFSFASLPTNVSSYLTLTASNSNGVSANSAEFWWITTPSTVSGFTNYGGFIGLAQSGSLTISNTTGTYTNRVVRALGLMVNGGQGFTYGTNANGVAGNFEPANLSIVGTTNGSSVDSFGDLSLVAGPFFVRLQPVTNQNVTLNFGNLSRTAGTQLNFGHSTSFGLGVGATNVGSGTNNSSVVFTNPLTSLLVGGGGNTNSPTVSILPFVFVNNGLATYDSTYGLRALRSAEMTNTLISGTNTTANVGLANVTVTLSSATSINALSLNTTTVNGSGSLRVTSGAIVVPYSSTISVATLDFGSSEGLINIANTRSLTLSSVITGSNGLTICLENYNNNTTALILGGANTYTGITRFLGNDPSMTVRLTNSLALQNSTLDYNNYGASFSFGNGGTSGQTNYTFGGLSGSQNIALINNNTTRAPVALTVGGDNDSTTYSGVLSGTNGSLIKIGTGTLTLSGTNTYTGITTINGGTLNLIGSLAGGVTVNNGGVLSLADGVLRTNTISGSLNLSGGAGLTFDAGGISESIALNGIYTAPTNGTVAVNINPLTNFGIGTYTLITGATNINASNFVIGSAPSGYVYSFITATNTLSLIVSLVPVTPGGVTAVGGTNQVVLGWNTSTGASGYLIGRATNAGGPYTTIATGLTNTSYTNTGLGYGTSYYYVVVATNASGSSSNSAEVTGLTIPAVPGGLSALGGTKQVTLGWSGVSGASGYVLSSATTSNGVYSVLATNITTSGYTNTGLLDGTLYYYRLMSWNASGTNTNVATISGLTAPGTPTGLSVTQSNGLVVVSWNAATGASGYNVLRSTDGTNYTVVASNLAATSYTNSGLTGGTTYYYQVQAANTTGTSTNSSGVNVLTPPNAPQGLSALGGTNQVVLGWNAATGASGYLIGQATNAGGPYTTIATGLTNTSYTNTGLGYGTSYYYVVVATNASGSSSNSAEVTGLTIPAVPGGLSALGGTKQVTLGWSGVSGASGYVLSSATTSNGVYSVLATNITTSGYTNTGLLDGTLYYYRLMSWNASGTNTNVATISGLTAPGTPTGLSVTQSNGVVVVSWNAATGASGYNVLRSSDGTNYTVVASNLAATSYTNSGLTGGTTYYFQVQAANTTGTSTNSSGVNVLTPPSAPASVTAVGGTNQVVLGWNTSTGASGYLIGRATNAGGPYTTIATGLTNTSYTNTGLGYGTSYYYVVVATNASGSSSNSAEVSAITTPGTTSALLATGGNSQVLLGWSAVSGATGYNALRSSTNGGPYAAIATNISSTTYTDTGLSNGTTYYYVVSALNASGAGSNSTQASATTYTAQQNWRLTNFGTASNAGVASDLATPLGDGVPNLLKYALGISPSTYGGGPVMKLSGTNSGSLQISFTRQDANLSYIVEGSTDLSTWTPLTTNPGSIGSPVTVTDTNYPTTGTTKRFIRLRVVSPGP